MKKRLIQPACLCFNGFVIIICPDEQLWWLCEHCNWPMCWGYTWNNGGTCTVQHDYTFTCTCTNGWTDQVIVNTIIYIIYIIIIIIIFAIISNACLLLCLLNVDWLLIYRWFKMIKVERALNVSVRLATVYLIMIISLALRYNGYLNSVFIKRDDKLLIQNQLIIIIELSWKWMKCCFSLANFPAFLLFL